MQILFWSLEQLRQKTDDARLEAWLKELPKKCMSLFATSHSIRHFLKALRRLAKTEEQWVQVHFMLI